MIPAANDRCARRDPSAQETRPSARWKTKTEFSHSLSGWALWNFRGPFGVLDTQRAGTKFEDWRPPARPPASRPAAEKNEGVESNRPPRRHALLCVLCGMS